jgi:hypothetical protein
VEMIILEHTNCYQSKQMFILFKVSLFLSNKVILVVFDYFHLKEVSISLILLKYIH